ncbi:GNAT family N-acetyltransferase [Micromonospora zhanjiangensis]
MAERATEFGHPVLTLSAGAIPTERRWIGTLRAAGFDFHKRHARMRRPLTGLPAQPPGPPAGVRIRPVRPDDAADLRRFHEILEAGFGALPDHQPSTYEQWWERVAAEPTVAWDEWFVAEVDGMPAGILQSSDRMLDQDEGWVRYLSVSADHRRRGIGAALLAAAFARYAAKGRRSAGLGVDLANPTEAARLYRSVGMTPVFEADIFQRTVCAAG